MDSTAESEPPQNTELKVNFFPELFLQRRIWILNILRKEGVREVCSALIAFSLVFIHSVRCIGSRHRLRRGPAPQHAVPSRALATPPAPYRPAAHTHAHAGRRRPRALPNIQRRGDPAPTHSHRLRPRYLR